MSPRVDQVLVGWRTNDVSPGWWTLDTLDTGHTGHAGHCGLGAGGHCGQFKLSVIMMLVGAAGAMAASARNCFKL